MDSLVVGIVAIPVLLVLLAAGMHIALALALVGVVGYGIVAGFNAIPIVVASAFFNIVFQFVYTCLPLFVLMGLLAAEIGVSKDFYDGVAFWTGRLKAGLGIATVGAATAFGTVCGSSLVTASVFAKISAPEMRAHGYDKKLAYGLCCAAGTIGMLIPPSILMVVYALLTDESVGRLLIAGIGPGLLLAVLFTLTLIIISRTNPDWIQDVPTQTVTWRQRLGSLKLFWSVLVVGGIIFGGIFTGVFTPTEAGAVASLAMLVLTLIITKGRSRQIISKAIVDTAEISGMIFLILCGAGVFSRFVAMTGLGQAIFQQVTSWNLPPYGLVWIMVIAYLVLGCFLDATSMLSITVPIVYKAVVGSGVDTIWYAMVVVVAIHIGLLTPPVGLNVFAVKAVAQPDVTLEDCFRGTIPFLIAMVVAQVMVFYLPPISTFLPKLMFK